MISKITKITNHYNNYILKCSHSIIILPLLHIIIMPYVGWEFALLQKMLDGLYDTTRNMDLKIKVSNVKITMSDWENAVNNCKLWMNEKKLKKAGEFIYLSWKLIKDGKLKWKMLTQVSLVRNVMGSMWSAARN